MIKQSRPKSPKWLTRKYQKWGKAFAIRKAVNSKAVFNWPQYRNKPVNKRLIPILSGMTQEHCSFCDSFPMGSMISSTIEHFKPKTDYPILALEWNNLYLCCGNCQQKGDDFSYWLLRPDAPLYNFERYFIYNYETGELEINTLANSFEQKKAATTIKLYKLNDFNRPKARKREYKKYKKSIDPNIDDFAYRYMY